MFEGGSFKITVEEFMLHSEKFYKIGTNSSTIIPAMCRFYSFRFTLFCFVFGFVSFLLVVVSLRISLLVVHFVSFGFASYAVPFLALVGFISLHVAVCC